MFENAIRRMPIGGLGLLGLVAFVLAGALLVMGVGDGNRSGAASPTATSNSANAFSPAATIAPAATVGQATPFSPAATANPSGRFTRTGSMATAREGQTATLLPGGRVLIAGGSDRTVVQDSAEVYDPDTGAFSPTGSMTTARSGHTATLLPDGRVLLAGGSDDSSPPKFNVFDSAELYDPGTGTFSPTGSMATPRWSHTATLLPNGRVLIAGGDDVTEGPAGALSSAELYNPATGKFIATGSMATARAWPTATLLSDGRVLLVGGVLLGAGPGPVASAELYDLTSGTFSLTGSMNPAHVKLTATLLRDGRVLIAGGWAFDGEGYTGMLYTAELFDPATGTFGPTGSTLNVRENATTTLLSDGRVLLVGGDDGDQALLDSAELYTP